MSKNDDYFVSISIPRELHKKISERIGESNSKIISNYITYVLNKELSQKKEGVYTEKDKKIIKERLRRLGYF